jgi:3-hydroxyisobutyrate dehydrogenase-like beta-hydroxyacid dehydrogenase
MKIGIIGSGVVAQTLGSKLIGPGHDLILGTGDPHKLDDKKNVGAPPCGNGNRKSKRCRPVS